MRTASDWHELLQIEPQFLALEKQIARREITDYRQIPTGAFALHGWDLLSEERQFAMTLPFLRQQVARAKASMRDIYGASLAAIDPAALIDEDAWHRVPVLMKDDAPEFGIKGFRQVANDRPTVMKPTDLKHSSIPFGSGGSMGKYTSTFVTLLDREREIHGFGRSMKYFGVTQGDAALYTYNTTHKGGQWIQESLMALGADTVVRRSDEGPERVLQNMVDYKVNVLVTVQQPYEAMQNQAKAAGVNLHSLIETSLENPEKYAGVLVPDENGRKQVEFIFLGGFEIVPYAQQLAKDYLNDTPIATCLGSSEAIPQACSVNPRLAPSGDCHLNNLHLLQGPHFVEIVKQSGDAWVPVAKGEEGLLVYTSWARDGTLWIRYAPGDVATKMLDDGECSCGIQSPVITNVHRKDAAERGALLVNGCAAG